MREDIIDFISKHVTPDMGRQYMEFCDWVRNDTEFNDDITASIFASLSFKKDLAKQIVKSILYDIKYDSVFFELYRCSLDARLRSLIKYYLSVEILNNPDLPEAKINEVLSSWFQATWISGRGIIDTSNEAVVRMTPKDSLYQGYRFFIINMLCFTADKFVLGFRTDGGPVISPMKYYKGCKPLGRRKSKEGIEWNVILCDRSLSDDHIAIFSNQLDGEGTLEVCDWISEHHQRVIFRCDW